MNWDTPHQEHREWLSQLDFYQDEIKIFQHDLMDVVQKHPNYFHMVEHVDEYRSILLRKIQHIDDLRHRIMLHVRHLALEHQEIQDTHEVLKSEMENFVQDFEEMKGNFRRFVSRNN